MAEVAAEQVKKVKAGQRGLARFLREAHRALGPCQRAYEAYRRFDDQIERRDTIDRASEDRRDRLKERYDQLRYLAEPKVDRLDVLKLLASLRDAYGISLPPGYSVELDPDYLTVLTETETPVRISTDALASPARLALEFGMAVELTASQPFRPGMIGSGLTRVEIADYKIENAERFGLSKEAVREVEWERQAAYDTLSDEYQRRVDLGDYDLAPGEASELPAE